MKNLIQKLAYRSVGLSINAISYLNERNAAERAFEVFCSTPKSNVRPKERSFLETATQTHEMALDATTPYVQYTWGDTSKPYVLCAYGWAYNAGRWRHFVPQLVEAGYCVVAFDPPGHGLCKGNRLNLLLNSGIIERILRKNGKPECIITHSFGGSSSMLALERTDPKLWPARMVVMASFSTPLPIFADFAKALGLRKTVLDGMYQIGGELLKRPMETVDLAAYSEKFGDIDALLVHDPKDDVTPFSHAERFAEHWPGAELFVAHKGGHHLGTQEITDRVVAHAIESKHVNM
jgi:pimeloyl-ACP methyl ester carboxylesterase